MRLWIAVALLALAPRVTASVDRAAAVLGDMKSHIAAKRYAAAVQSASDGFDAAAAISDVRQREQALTALHFYAALARWGSGDEEQAREHLQEFFDLAPSTRHIDPAKYDAGFVALFADVAREAPVGAESFEALYPGYPASTAAADPEDTRGASRALEILGSKQEKRSWQSILAPADRAAFIANFWKSRDRTPATAENEFREAFLKRVAFADSAFGAGGEPGSLTDRGRVFVVLGEPALVRRRAISSRDAIQSFNVGSIGINVGTIEYWFYRREQLPISHQKPTITFRFVSHQGIGTFVLQRDGLAINTLTAAMNPGSRE